MRAYSPSCLLLLALSVFSQPAWAGPIGIGSHYEEIIELLGAPKGEMNVGSKQFLIYDDVRIELEDGTLRSLSPEVKEFLRQRAASGVSKGDLPQVTESLHPTAGTWLTDFDEAVAIAKITHQKLLLNFTGSDWCGWCIRLDQEVFSQKEFLDYARKHYVLVKIDFPVKQRLPWKASRKNKKLSKKYKVKGYPTILVLHPSGELYKRGGYVRGGPAAFLASIR